MDGKRLNRSRRKFTNISKTSYSSDDLSNYDYKMNIDIFPLNKKVTLCMTSAINSRSVE